MIREAPAKEGAKGPVEVGPARFFIETLEGKMEAKIGDWIITGVKGEMYPCKPDIFEKTYSEVSEVETLLALGNIEKEGTLLERLIPAVKAIVNEAELLCSECFKGTPFDGIDHRTESGPYPCNNDELGPLIWAARKTITP